MLIAHVVGRTALPLKQEAQVTGTAVPEALWALDLWIILQMRHASAVLGTLCFVVGPLAPVIFWHVRAGQHANQSGRGDRNPIAWSTTPEMSGRRLSLGITVAAPEPLRALACAQTARR